jgi:hypothetical protein
MADSSSGSTQATTVRAIDYRAAFAFVQLFRGFRLAIDPSKILLAMAAILMLYTGGRLLDSIWPIQHRAVQKFSAVTATTAADGELPHYRRSSDFAAERESMRRVNQEFVTRELQKNGHTNVGYDPRLLLDVLKEDLQRQLKTASELRDKAAADLSANPTTPVFDYDLAVREAYDIYARRVAEVEAAMGEGLFIHFLNYEIAQVDRIVWNAINLRIDGVLGGLRDFFITAPAWAVKHHPVFFTLFFAWFLLLWAIFGGAIARVSAVQVARDEKISVRQALRFSTGKVLSFAFAPLIPIIIIAVIGVLIAIVSLPLSIPYLGGLWSIVMGVLFVLMLLAGLVMMLTAVGLIGGGHLMYPTIAAEGSDSFDAVSRSFSYLYARPWQLMFYTLVALVYGAVTYLFVRLAIYILFALVHGAMALLQWNTAANGTPIVDALWPAPTTFTKLSFETSFAPLSTAQSMGAFFMTFWVYLAIALIGAYAVSLYFSSSTVIYYLLRKEVDATEPDEVYIEPGDDDFAEAAIETPAETPAEEPVAESATSSSTAEPAPPANPT